ncbi:glutamine-hydrolyzing GMP synthase [Siminovitchia fordii]|uniref:Glutamine amidotransferase n=1 Tax=Siminovitchia fordii TaxID=254759 RepID=A0ABQ4KAX3_9BACI|nr:glutamine-hydrolyzing GMP synthase [Siminovitchia fordii]GIN22766.1 hypothetical protein J1TS3_39000 [Siminovitchia fordii]
MTENNEIRQEMIVVLDFGDPFDQLIVRRIRELGVNSKLLHPRTASTDEIKKLNPKGIILSGGPRHVHSDNAISLNKEIFNLRIPILGICYGMQLIAAQFDGKVERREKRTYGQDTIQIKDGGPELFKGIPEKLDVWMSFGDSLKGIPAGFVIDAESEKVPVAAISNTASKFYGIQFHPEAEQSEYGTEILKNFVFGLCHCNEQS